MLIKATTKKTDVFSKFLMISSLYHLPRWKSSIKRCKANLYHGYNVSNPEENGVSNVFQTCCDDMAFHLKISKPHKWIKISILYFRFTLVKSQYI